MTKSQLKMRVFGVTVFLGILLLLALRFESFHHFLKDFASIFLAVAAAYLAYCFQRRQTFLTSLRDLWNKAIEAKAELIDYMHNPRPNQESFGKAHRSISTAIDMVRAVYCNVSESRTSIGLYPFEPLHDMRKALERMGFENVTDAQRTTERKNVLQAWNAFRWSFLREFSTPKPSHYITVRNAVDPRRVSETTARDGKNTGD